MVAADDVGYSDGLAAVAAGVVGVEADEVAGVVVVDAQQLPLYVVGVVADDGLVGVEAVAVVDVRRWDKATVVPGAGHVT